MDSVVCLNCDYSYLNTVGIKDALRYIKLGKVTVEKYTKKFIRTTDGKVRIPLVVRFIKMIRQIYKRRVEWSRSNVITRDGGVCQYCGIDEVQLRELHQSGKRIGRKMTVDHIVPKAHGGKNEWENTCCACPDCNNRKGDSTCADVGMWPKKKSTQPTIMEFLIMKSSKKELKDILDGLWD